ncbi:MAG: MarR family transcriptional regulator [Cyanobacteria bacterium J06623_5]
MSDHRTQQKHLANIITAGRRVHAAVDMVDHVISRRLGVHRNDLRALNLLEDGPLSPKEISDRTGLTSGSTTALIDRLEKAGFVERQPSKTDRRSIEVKISPQRYAEIGILYRQCAEALMQTFDKKTSSELEISEQTLSAFAKAMEQVVAALVDEH